MGAHAWADETDWDFPETLEILRNGWLNFSAGFGIVLTDGVTGSIATWNGIRLFHQRGSAPPTELISATQPILSGAGSRENFYVNWRTEVLAGDVVFFVYRYRDGTTIDWDNVRLTISFMVLSIEPRIRSEYVA